MCCWMGNEIQGKNHLESLSWELMGWALKSQTGYSLRLMTLLWGFCEAMSEKCLADTQ